MAVESEEILIKISDLIESKVDELSTNLNNFRQEASNNNQTLENAIGSIKSVIDEKLSKIDEISSMAGGSVAGYSSPFPGIRIRMKQKEKKDTNYTKNNKRFPYEQ